MKINNDALRTTEVPWRLMNGTKTNPVYAIRLYRDPDESDTSPSHLLEDAFEYYLPICAQARQIVSSPHVFRIKFST